MGDMADMVNDDSPDSMTEPLRPREREPRAPAPFLKWVGGKRQLLPQLVSHLPQAGKMGHYYEPFLGGGALFFELRNRGWRGPATLGDANELLIRTYRGVRNDVEGVIEYLKDSKYGKKEYLEERARSLLMYTKPDDDEVGAWFIYINKCGFNGLWRVNKKGECNVPFGKYTNPLICDAERLRAASRALQRTKLTTTDFEKTLRNVESGDLVYLDPPYLPVSTTANFTSYTRDGFTWQDQVRLRDCALRLKRLGAHVILSNADVPAVHELYGGRAFRIHRVEARRAINSRGSARGPVGEVIIV